MIKKIFFIMCLPLMAFAAEDYTEPRAGTITGEERDATLARIEERLNGIKSMTADFIQRAPDGSVSEGKFFMERPGKIRFEYGEDVPFLMVSNGSMISFIDYEVRQVTRWPIGKTPLGILVEKNIRFDDRVEIPDIIRFAGLVKVSVIDPKRKEQGYITLIFEESSMELRAWEVLDAQGYLTRVSLVNPVYNVAIDQKKFTFKDPRGKSPIRGPRK